MSVLDVKRQKVLSYIGASLCLGQLLLMLASWLLTAAWPEDFSRSLLSAEGIRWFFGRFQYNLASPLLVWLVVGSIAYGAYVKSRISHYNHREYRQRFAMGVASFELAGFVLVMLALTLLPHAILLNVMGGLLPSSFTQSIIPYCAFSLTVVFLSFGLISGSVKGIRGMFGAMELGIVHGAPYFVLYVFAAQLYESIKYLW